MIIVFGFTTRSQKEAPVVIYCGNSGSDAQSAIEASTVPRVERVNHPQTIPVRGWTAERAAAHEEAVAQVRGEDELTETGALRERLAQMEQEKIRAELDVVGLRKSLAELQAISQRSAVVPRAEVPVEKVSERIPATIEPGSGADAAGPALTVGEDDGPSLLAGMPGEAPAPRSRRR